MVEVINMNKHPLAPQLFSNKSIVPDYYKEHAPLHYTADEIDDVFLPLFKENTYAGKQHIISLLKATSIFLHASTLWPEFKNARDSIYTYAKIHKILNDIGIALNEAVKKKLELAQKNGLAKENKLEQVFAETINYCLECIDYKLKELSTAKDTIFLVYEAQDNELKKVFPSSTQSFLFKHS